MTDDTPWLSGDEIVAWVHLTAMMMSLPPAIDAQLKRDAGINFFEYTILTGLSQAPGRALQLTTLAGYASGSLSRLSHALTRLERQGWVTRRTCTREARASEAVLTDAGMAKLVATAPGHVREVRRLVIDVLTPDELTQLRAIARRLVDTASPRTAAILDDALGRLPEREPH